MKTPKQITDAVLQYYPTVKAPAILSSCRTALICEARYVIAILLLEEGYRKEEVCLLVKRNHDFVRNLPKLSEDHPRYLAAKKLLHDSKN